MSGYAYRIAQVIDAPKETVWSAWTERARFEKLFHAKPGSAALDVRPGGSWQVTMIAPDGSEVPMSGSYGAVDPGRRLVTLMDTPGREASSAMELELVEVEPGRTEVALSQVCDSQEEHDFSKEGSQVLLQWCADAARR